LVAETLTEVYREVLAMAGGWLTENTRHRSESKSVHRSRVELSELQFEGEA